LYATYITNVVETVYFGPELHISVPTVIEVYDTIRRMKDNRAPGEDATTAELIKESGRSLWKIFTN
jgi:hypothetical protein